MALKYLSPIHRATRQIGLWFEERMPELVAAEGHMLSYLLPYGPARVTELVRVFGVKHSTMTSILDRLEKRGLIERKVNPDDARSFLVSLTRKGQTMAKKVNALIEELEREIDKRVTKEQLAALNAVVDGISEATKIEVRKK